MTNFYRHYKNKPYRFIGTVRHSETLEEMSFYECLYENKLGKLWVRPKQMFFENVVIEGQERPRFEKIEFRIEETETISAKQLEIIFSLSEKIFINFKRDKFESNLKAHTQFHCLIAYDENLPVAFKVGYARNKYEFYSWHGGVIPDYRRLGLAKVLMSRQHQWAVQQKFARIETRTRNKFPEMIYLNLKSGFKIVGCTTESTGETKIIMQKEL